MNIEIDYERIRAHIERINHRQVFIALLVVVVFGPLFSSHASAQTPILNAAGPWLIYTIHDDKGYANQLWAANPDGSAPTELVKDKTIAGFAAAPRGGLVSYIAGDYPPGGDAGYVKPTLHLLALPGGQDKLITPLTNATTEPPGNDRAEAIEAIVALDQTIASGSMQWSPDGQTLAFIGAQGTSTSADLYVYSAATKKVTQLSSGASQAISPSWSPDGKYIVHFGVNGFGSGAGNSMAGAWAAKADGTGIITLFQPKPGDGELGLAGWTGPTTFITYTWRPNCEYENLQTFDIVTKQEKVWYSGAFDVAAWSPSGQSLLIVVGDYSFTPECQIVDPGLYLSTPTKPDPRMIGPISSGDNYLMQWSPAANQFFLEEDRKGVPIGVFSIKPDGTQAGNWPMPTLPSISPDGKNMAWIEDGALNISDVQNYNPVNVAENVQSVGWVP